MKSCLPPIGCVAEQSRQSFRHTVADAIFLTPLTLLTVPTFEFFSDVLHWRAHGHQVGKRTASSFPFRHLGSSRLAKSSRPGIYQPRCCCGNKPENDDPSINSVMDVGDQLIGICGDDGCSVSSSGRGRHRSGALGTGALSPKKSRSDVGIMKPRR